MCTSMHAYMNSVQNRLDLDRLLKQVYLIDSTKIYEKSKAGFSACKVDRTKIYE